MAFLPPYKTLNKISDGTEELSKMKNDINSSFNSVNKSIDDFKPPFELSPSNQKILDTAKAEMKGTLNEVKNGLSNAVNTYDVAALDIQRKIKKLDTPTIKNKFPLLIAIYKDCKSISMRGAINSLPIPKLPDLSCIKELEKLGTDKCGIVKSLENTMNGIKDKITPNLNKIMDSVKDIDESIGGAFANIVEGKCNNIVDGLKDMTKVADTLKGSVETVKNELVDAYNNAIEPAIKQYVVPNIKCAEETWNKYVKDNPDFEKYGKYTWKNGNIVRKNNVD